MGSIVYFEKLVSPVIGDETTLVVGFQLVESGMSCTVPAQFQVGVAYVELVLVFGSAFRLGEQCLAIQFQFDGLDGQRPGARLLQTVPLIQASEKPLDKRPQSARADDRRNECYGESNGHAHSSIIVKSVEGQ